MSSECVLMTLCFNGMAKAVLLTHDVVKSTGNATVRGKKHISSRHLQLQTGSLVSVVLKRTVQTSRWRARRVSTTNRQGIQRKACSGNLHVKSFAHIALASTSAKDSAY